MFSHQINRVIPFILSCLLAACGGGGGGGNDPMPAPPPGGGSPVVSVANAAIEEGDTGTTDMTFTVSLSASSASTVTVDFTTADGTADASDYDAVSTSVSIPAGQLSVGVVVPLLGDLEVENDEEFTVGLTNPVGASLGMAIGVGSIVNDDFPLLSVADATVDEGDTGTVTLSFEVSLDQPGVSEITVDYATSDVTAAAGSDYTAASGTLTIPAGDVLAAIDVTVSGDTETEADEQLLVNLLNASPNARINDDEGIGIIRSDDLPKASIEPAVIEEADTDDRSLTLLVTLNVPAVDDVEIAYATTAGTATPGDDYTESAGTVIIPAGSLDVGITLNVVGDTLIENAETIEVELTDIVGPATLGQVIAYGTILDNDDPNAELTLTGSGGGVIEGDSGTTDMRFQFTLSKLAVEDITVVYNTVDGSAVSPDDYVPVAGSVLIPIGEAAATVLVPVVGDTLEEAYENVLLNIAGAGPQVTIGLSELSASIIDDDTPSTEAVRLSIAPSEVIEGNTGTTDLVFDVTLDKASADPITVDYLTDPGSATEGVDYNLASGTLTFQPGELAKTVTVEVIGDGFSEDDEFFRVRLSNLTGGALFDRSSALGTILTDEPLVRLSIADVGGAEGDSDTSDQLFTVLLDGPSAGSVTFEFATNNGTAIAGEDYLLTSGAAQILAGDLSATISVPINGDTINENDETYVLALSNVSTNAVVLDDVATGTIVNDDGLPGWQAPRMLGRGREPDVALDANGDGAIVYTGPVSGVTFTASAQVTRIMSGQLQAPIELGDYSDGAYRPPLAATLGNGEIMVTWAGNIGSAVYSPAAGWVEQEVYSLGGFFPTLDGNNSGMAIAGGEVSFGGSGPYSAWRNSYASGVGWSTAELAENDDTGAVGRVKATIDDAGNRFMMWGQSFSDPALSGAYFDYYSAATSAWLGADRFDEVLGLSNYDIGMLGDGRAVLAVQMPGPSPVRILVFFYDPATGFFLNSGAVSLAGSESELIPTLEVDGDGNVFVAWLQLRADGDYDAWSNRYDALAGSWGVATRLEASDGNVLASGGGIDLAVDGNGNAIAVWSQATVVPTDEYRIRSSFYSVADDEWSPAEQIDDGNLDEFPGYVRVGMDAAGNAEVVWEYQNANDIGAASYVAP